MIMKTENAKWIPPLEELQNSGVNKHGWLAIDEFDSQTIWEITDIHFYNGYGRTLETYIIKSGKEVKEIYSLDEGETFTFDLGYEG